MSVLSNFTGKLLEEKLNRIEHDANRILKDIGVMTWEYVANKENPNQEDIDRNIYKLNPLFIEYKQIISEIHNKVKNHPEVIPKDTIYCYTGIGKTTKVCPYWTQSPFDTDQNNGVCMFMNKFDNSNTLGLLWDQCKICGIEEGDEEGDEE